MSLQRCQLKTNEKIPRFRLVKQHDVVARTQRWFTEEYTWCRGTMCYNEVPNTSSEIFEEANRIYRRILDYGKLICFEVVEESEQEY
jgi:hypothetical protein